MPHNNEGLIWRGKDYKSRTVSLYVDERDHINDHHEIMQTNYTAVYDTLQSPSAVYASTLSSDREVFFKCSAEASYYPKYITKVIVAYPEKGSEGYVVTAFNPKSETGGIGEKLYSKKDI